jgi:uncharacterized protein YjbI with pentapeptide repeats
MAFIAICLAATGAQHARADDCRNEPAPDVNWQNCDKTRLMLGGSDFKNAKLLETDFTTTDLRNTNLSGADLEKAKLVRASLAGATATGARFARIEAYRTDFGGIAADGASFESAELQRSNFKDAKLSKTNFTKADLGRSQFDGAELGGSRFALANVSRTDFRGARFSSPVDFDRAFFFLARLEGLDLSAATGLSQWQVDMACGDDTTVLPPGLNTPAQWPCKFDQD